LIPLATSFDAPGLIAASGARLRRTDMALIDRDPRYVAPRAISEARLIVPRESIHAGQTDPEVIERFDEWLRTLAASGVTIVEEELPMMTEASIAAREGSVIAVEAYDWHRDLIATEFDRYDQRVAPRIRHGATVLAADYVEAQRKIDACRRRYDAAVHHADAVVTPTVPIIPPRVADVQAMETYLAMNTEVLRLTEFANRLDLPSVSIPGRLDEREPIGLMLTGRRGGDAALLDLAVMIEACLAGGD
jgi:Asp-tRNA(Asn)/Glu-tRNA(Gln) amidotransferase A subunit family amidase